MVTLVGDKLFSVGEAVPLVTLFQEAKPNKQFEHIPGSGEYPERLNEVEDFVQ